MTLWPFKNRKSRRELEVHNATLRTALENQAKSIGELQHDLEKAQNALDRSTRKVEGLQAIMEVKEARISQLESEPLPTVKIDLIPSPSLTLAKWLKEENLIASAATILKHPDMRAMLDVLRNEHPAIKGIALGTPIDQRAIFQARGEGYQLCLNNLMALGEKPTKKQEIQETYAEENVTGKKP